MRAPKMACVLSRSKDILYSDENNSGETRAGDDALGVDDGEADGEALGADDGAADGVDDGETDGKALGDDDGEALLSLIHI